MIKQDKVNILLVDDRPDKLMALEAALADLKQNVIKVSSGHEALRLLLQQEFAVVILDVHMPIMDGFETAALIRQRLSTEHTPIIFVTGINTTETHVSRGYSLGAVDYIFAPVEPVILRAKVSVFIDLFKKSEQIKRQAELLRKKAEQRAEDLEARLHILLNRLNVGVFRSSLEGRLIEANPAFLRLLRVESVEEANQLDLRALYMPLSRQGLQSAASQDNLKELDVQLNRADGTALWVSLSNTIVVVPESGNSYIDGLIEDITLRKETEEALILKTKELSRSNSELEQFAFIASHDLQEPLRVISCYSSLLLKQYGKQLGVEPSKFLNIMMDSAQHMHNLVKDLLLFSRVQGHDAEGRVVNCEDIVAQAIFYLRTAIDESGAVISKGDLPEIWGNSRMLVQLFQNILSNAIKFRGSEAPVISISAIREGEFWKFAIVDNGIGIAPEYHQSIFKIFKRLHRRDEYPGTGIGLALCRKVVEGHGGHIGVDSMLGKGATFYFTLPVIAKSRINTAPITVAYQTTAM